MVHKITGIHREWMLEDFAMGYAPCHVHRKLTEQGVQLSRQAVSKWYNKWLRNGALYKKQQQITEFLPMSDKGIRIKHLQSMYRDIEGKLETDTKNIYSELLKLQKDILRQIAEEMGDIKKGGANVPITINTGAKPEYAPEDERRTLLRILSEKASEDKN